MKPITLAVATLAAVVVLLVGCGSNDEAAPLAPVTPITTTSATTLDGATTTAPSSSRIGSPTSVRGALIKELGQLNGLGCPEDFNGPCEVEFTIDEPILATNCSTQYRPENGEVIKAFPVAVTTDASFQADGYYNDMFNPYGFSVVQSNGVTLPQLSTVATYGCDESDRTIPTTLAPASMYEGFVVLDYPADASTLLFLPTQSQGGWEFALASP